MFDNYYIILGISQRKIKEEAPQDRTSPFPFSMAAQKQSTGEFQ